MQKSPYAQAKLAASDCNGQGIGASYIPGTPRSFIITLQDDEGKYFLATVHYKHVQYPLTCTVVQVVSAEGCDITFCDTIQSQMTYFTQKAELEAQGQTLMGTIAQMEFMITQNPKRATA